MRPYSYEEVEKILETEEIISKCAGCSNAFFPTKEFNNQYNNKLLSMTLSEDLRDEKFIDLINQTMSYKCNTCPNALHNGFYKKD